MYVYSVVFFATMTGLCQSVLLEFKSQRYICCFLFFFFVFVKQQYFTCIRILRTITCTEQYTSQEKYDFIDDYNIM